MENQEDSVCSIRNPQKKMCALLEHYKNNQLNSVTLLQL